MVAFVRSKSSISDMSTSTMAAIQKEFEQVEPGTAIPTARLLRHGTRAAVDQALTRLVRSGQLERAARGVYSRPRNSRLVGPVLDAEPRQEHRCHLGDRRRRRGCGRLRESGDDEH